MPTAAKTLLIALILAVCLAGSAKAGPPVGDLNRDWEVNLEDLRSFAYQWLASSGSSADFDGVNGVNISDFAILAGNWRKKAGALVISEFMAINDSNLPDPEDPTKFWDWIEIYNPADVNVSLNGWYLTYQPVGENLVKWKFPSVELDPGEFLVVFASEENHRDPSKPLHTNFKLRGSGGYLGLVTEDGVTVSHEYAPQYPQQLGNISYGLRQNATTLMPTGISAFYYVPTKNDANWTAVDFNDRGWAIQKTPVSFAITLETGQDIGSPSARGSYSFDNGVYSIKGDGADIWGTSDSFYYIYASLKGDGELTARVVSMDNTNDWAKAGAMIRETLDAGSRYAMMLVSANTAGTHGVSFQYRTTAGGSSASSSGGAMKAPYWVRIKRVGNVLSGYVSPDGINWTQQGSSQTIAMTEEVYVGLGVTSHVSGMLCTAVFDNVKVKGSNRVTSNLRQKMLGINTSLWTRIKFGLTAEQVDLFDSLTLRVRYEDGFVAYLNGQQVARRNAPASPQWNSPADSNRPNNQSLAFESINIMAYKSVLHSGINVLAIQALNDNNNDEEFLILPRLMAAVDSSIPEYFTTATPGAFNIAGALGIVDDVFFSRERGFYDSPFYLTLCTDDPNAEIHYTFDGSRPPITPETIYTSPLWIDRTVCVRALAFKPGYLDSTVASHTYIFLNDVITQSQQQALDAGCPSSWSGYPADYEMDPEICQSPSPYAGLIRAAMLAIPTMSIATDNSNLFDPSYGIYTNPSQTGWERPASVEFFDPNGLKVFQIDCGLRLQGGASRTPQNAPKHSFSLRFREDYGSPTLDFPLFDGSPVESFDSVHLRAKYNNSWFHWDSAQRRRAQYIRDQWIRDSLLDMGEIAAGRGAYVHLYINGMYWGLYNLCERQNASHYAAYYGGDKDKLDAIKGNEAVDGDFTAWNEVKSIVASRNWEQIQQVLDVDSYIDWTIINRFGRNLDLKTEDNWRAVGGGPDRRMWKFYSWDAERVLEDANNTNLPSPVADPPGLFDYLDDINEFRIHFADRLHKHFFNGGALTPDKTIPLWMKWANELDLAIIAESARWGDYRRDVHQYSNGPYELYTKNDHWLVEKARLLSTYFPVRSDKVLQRYKSDGLYPNVVAPVFYINGSYKHGGYILPTDQLSMTAPAGTIYYTTDGNDPRLPGISQSTGITLVAGIAAKRVKVPTGDVNDNWKGGGTFDDSTWTSVTGSPGGVGYDRNTGSGGNYLPYISLNVEPNMYGKNPTCYLRIPFTANAGDIGDFNSMTLNMLYDDGFIVYINGTEVKRENFSGTPQWNSSTGITRDAGTTPESFDISSYLGELRSGDNILAIHGLNSSINGNDFLITAELVAGKGPFTLNKNTHVKSRVLSGTTWSALNEAVFAIGPVAENLRITEIMYHPEDTNDPNDPNEEFIELKNSGAQALNLNLVKFTNGIDFTFPNLELAGGQYVVVVKNRAAFNAQYPGFSGIIAGQYTGSLENAGERIRLEDALGGVILDFEYKDGWREITDGNGFSLTIINPSDPNINHWGEKDYWRASVYWGGSPGWDDSGFLPNPGAVVINEVLAHSHAAAADWIELYNTTNSAINIGNWYLSDSGSNLKKYKIAAGTSIPQNGYKVFYEDTDFNNPGPGNPGCLEPFRLSENGETVYLSSAEPDGVLTGYRDVEDFGASLTDVSFGRYHLGSTGNYNFVAMSAKTLNGSNAYPKVGPVVINEIMYNPDWPEGGLYSNEEYEYIELRNISGSSVTLYDSNEHLPWKFTNGIEYTFPASPAVPIPAGGYIVVVRNKTAFSNRYSSVPSGKIYGPYSGHLNNGGESLELSQPGDVDEFGERHYIRVDRVNYSDGSHPQDCPGGVDLWPVEADGLGKSLSRKVASAYGNDPNNWTAATPSPAQ